MKTPKYSIVALAIFLGIIVGTSAGYAGGLLLLDGFGSGTGQTLEHRNGADLSNRTSAGNVARTQQQPSALSPDADTVRIQSLQALTSPSASTTTVQVSRSIPADISIAMETLPFCVFDTDESGFIERLEAVEHITTWLLGLDGPRGQMTRDDAIEIVTAYLLQLPIVCDE